MNLPDDLLYNNSHEWIRRREDGLLEVGITDFAQGELGDVVYAEPPVSGQQAARGDTVCSLESVKAVSDIYAPVSGTLVEFNAALNDAPELINQSPYDEGWLFRIRPDAESQLGDLLSAEDYKCSIGGT